MPLFAPGIFPEENSTRAIPEAERKVYDALKSSLPFGWYAWHSLKLRTETKGEFCEADFLIADPSRPSLLVLEVKGGQVEKISGQWCQNGFPLKKSPLDQALHFRGQLIERFKDNKALLPTTGVAVCFPDTFFSCQPTQDDLKGLVIGGQDLPHLEKILQDVMERAIPQPRPVKGPWLKLLNDFWGESWIPKLRLGDRIRLDSSQRIQLDKDQLERLDEIEENDRVLILGAAGTGKTILAAEAALRQAEKGKKVLFLCFTDALAQWLEKSIRHPGITVSAIRHFASRLLGENPPENLGTNPSDYWNLVSLRAAIDGLPKEGGLWDSVIVDEGQDLSEEDWYLLQECGNPSARVWVFADENQAFWENRKIPAAVRKDCFCYRLNKPYRNPPEIKNLADCYAGRCQLDFDLVMKGIRDKVIRLVACSGQKVFDKVGKEINRLLGEGLKPGEIAVISVRGRSAVENICHLTALGGNRVVSATDPEADSHIICDTFLRFKGLERPAVIVTDLRLVSNLYDTRMHIAVSRPTSLLRIVAFEKEIRKDPRLSKLL